MPATWKFYDVRVAVCQESTDIGSQLFYVKARNENEAMRKALKEAEEVRNPRLYGMAFFLRVVSVKAY